MKKVLFFCIALCAITMVKAQETLTLNQCLQMAIDNNLSLKISRNEVAKGKQTISENRAKLYPQINAVAQLNDNFTPPVSVTDGSAYGKSYNVTKTLQYNASAGLQLQMPLYNQMVLTAIDISKTVDHLNQLSYEKAREDLIVQTAKAYYMAQNTLEQIRLVNDNIKRLEELRDITQAFYDNQMSLEVDLKRVNLNIENLTAGIKSRYLFAFHGIGVKFLCHHAAGSYLGMIHTQRLCERNLQTLNHVHQAQKLIVTQL